MKEKLHCDVLVIGGGSSGVAAAVAAARARRDVILIERLGFLGGKATSASVGTICGLYFTSPDRRSRYVTDGFPREFAETIRARTGQDPLSNRLGLHFLPYNPFDFSRTCDEVLRSSGARIFLHAALTDVSADDRIRQVETVVLDRGLTIVPSVVVDCTGEALCTTLSGHEAITGDQYQTASQVFSMEAVTDAAENTLTISIIRGIQLAVRDRMLPEALSRVSIVPGSARAGRVDLKISLPLRIDDALNKATPVELAAREAVELVSRILILRVAEFARAHLANVAPEAGIRTGRRSPGRHFLTREEVMRCLKHSDSAARGSWPIEKWGYDRKPTLELLAVDDFYDVPTDCLRAASLTNLFFGGRHISADEDAIASARVIGTCLATGFAAGSLAAGASAP